MKNRKITLERPIFVFKKTHLCPDCGCVIIPKKVKKIVNSKSPEAKNFDFSTVEGYLRGDVEFTYFVFYCNHCDKEFEIKEIKNFERKNKENEIEQNCSNKCIKKIKLFINRMF
jgi:hypothetical protein